MNLVAAMVAQERIHRRIQANLLSENRGARYLVGAMKLSFAVMVIGIFVAPIPWDRLSPQAAATAVPLFIILGGAAAALICLVAAIADNFQPLSIALIGHLRTLPLSGWEIFCMRFYHLSKGLLLLCLPLIAFACRAAWDHPSLRFAILAVLILVMVFMALSLIAALAIASLMAAAQVRRGWFAAALAAAVAVALVIGLDPFFLAECVAVFTSAPAHPRLLLVIAAEAFILWTLAGWLYEHAFLPHAREVATRGAGAVRVRSGPRAGSVRPVWVIAALNEWRAFVRNAEVRTAGLIFLVLNLAVVGVYGYVRMGKWEPLDFFAAAGIFSYMALLELPGLALSGFMNALMGKAEGTGRSDAFYSMLPVRRGVAVCGRCLGIGSIIFAPLASVAVIVPLVLIAGAALSFTVEILTSSTLGMRSLSNLPGFLSSKLRDMDLYFPWWSQILLRVPIWICLFLPPLSFGAGAWAVLCREVFSTNQGQLRVRPFGFVLALLGTMAIALSTAIAATLAVVEPVTGGAGYALIVVYWAAVLLVFGRWGLERSGAWRA